MQIAEKKKGIVLSEAERDILLEYFPQGIIAFDTETTGLSPLVDSIIELSAVKLTSHGISYFDELINPGIHIPENTTAIHGITDEMVKGKRGIKSVLYDFLKFSKDIPLLAHNAKFDVGFLIFDLFKQELPIPSSAIYCSCQFSRKAFSKFKSHRLGNLAAELKIPLESHHRALDDSLVSLTILAKGILANEDGAKSAIEKAKLYQLSDFNRVTVLDIPRHLHLLEDSVATQRPLMIVYRGGSIKGDRPIKPIGLLPTPTGPILYAHCLETNLYKSFALPKITSVRLPNEAEEVMIHGMLKKKEEAKEE